jgi:hypothetical protein
MHKCDHGWLGTTEHGPIWCEECQEGVQGALNVLTGHLRNLALALQLFRNAALTPWEESWHDQLRDELKRGLVKRRQLKRRLRELVAEENAAAFAKDHARLTKYLADRDLLLTAERTRFQPGRGEG